MIIFKSVSAIHGFIEKNKNSGLSIGFVPTMGALHNGHISLIEHAKQQTGLVICSIFVNPTQFNDAKDFEKYPVRIDKDIFLLEEAGCDVLFLPDVLEMYPDGLTNSENFDVGYLANILDGKYRPGHFNGVCQVMDRLLRIALPDKLFMGQKDFQQCMVLKKMTAQNFPSVQLIICPTKRESDGLAMSSRNVRLTTNERTVAVKIYETLLIVRDEIKTGSLIHLKEWAVQNLINNGFKVDYVEIADAGTLELLTAWNGQTPIVILIAAFLNEVRLIDNLIDNY